MALRSSWEGFLKLSLISIPVRAFNAVVSGGGDIHFHQIHKECGSRVRHQKVCPIHGEVTKEEVVPGYEYEKGEYVEIDPTEISKLRARKDDSIEIESFVAPDSLDPIYLSGKTHFIVPSGSAGQKPYALLHQVMKEKRVHALARVIMSGHEETVLIRPSGKLLLMTLLYYDHQLKSRSTFEDEVGEATISPQEVKLATTLVEASKTRKVDVAKYKDLYTERVKEMVEAKLSGKKIKAPKAERSRSIINLAEALRKSLEQAGGGAKKKRPRGKAARKTA
jgi:DNA end-binding protein Ku